MQNPEIATGAYEEGDKVVKPEGQIAAGAYGEGDRAVRPEGQVTTDPRKGCEWSGRERDTGM
ncbi:hypothetical protein Taro_023877 [Colocasia esculenta]|uniref:Uncharacterized protein n=1 Tax=Colocasia esculenta TaxID=4460 RepID=A0A843V5W0_COLES|nr:hypothetical protein [Colocasia esculenta]